MPNLKSLPNVIARLDRAYDQLGAKGVVFDHPPADDTWYTGRASLAEPDGKALALCASLAGGAPGRLGR